MPNICIIPARGGSKRIPRKNIMNFLGKPIIAYSIEAAVDSGLFDEVMVSTDDIEIADISSKYGAKIPFLRSKENSNDYAGTFDVIKEVIDKYKNLGSNFTYGCCIYPTAPFVTADKLKEAALLLERNCFDSVFPMIQYSYPIQRSLVINDMGKIRMKFPEYYTIRSQDTEPTYHDAGQFYYFDTKIIDDGNSLWTNNSGGIIISPIEGQDIDNLEDWEIAKMKFKILNESKKKSFI